MEILIILYVWDKRMRQTKANANLVLILTVLIWSNAFIAIKVAVAEVSSFLLVVARFGVAAVPYLILFIFKRNLFVPLEKKDFLQVLFISLISTVGYHMTLNTGEQLIAAGTASLIIATTPIITSIMSKYFLNEELSARKLIGILISFSGVLVLVYDAYIISFDNLVGILITFLAPIFWSANIVFSKPLMKKYDSFSLNGYYILLSQLVLVPVGFFTGIEVLLNVSITTFAAIFFLGFFCSFVAYTLWLFALNIKEASTTAIFINFIPLLALVNAFLLLNEIPSFLVLVGGLLILVGVYLVERSEK